jgi:hypothetical protein
MTDDDYNDLIRDTDEVIRAMEARFDAQFMSSLRDALLKVPMSPKAIALARRNGSLAAIRRGIEEELYATIRALLRKLDKERKRDYIALDEVDE